MEKITFREGHSPDVTFVTFVAILTPWVSAVLLTTTVAVASLQTSIRSIRVNGVKSSNTSPSTKECSDVVGDNVGECGGVVDAVEESRTTSSVTRIGLEIGVLRKLLSSDKVWGQGAIVTIYSWLYFSRALFSL